jgi:hypothetical protein
MDWALPVILGLIMIMCGRLMRSDLLIVPGSLVLIWGGFFAIMSTITPWWPNW